MKHVSNYFQFISEKKKNIENDKKTNLSALKPGKITTDDDITKEEVEKTKSTKNSEKNTRPSTSGASSGNSDVRSPTSTRTEVRSPTSTETSTDAYTSGNVTVTGGAGAGNTTVHIHSTPEEYKRLKSGEGRKKHMPSAVEQPGPNDPKSY